MACLLPVWRTYLFGILYMLFQLKMLSLSASNEPILWWILTNWFAQELRFAVLWEKKKWNTLLRLTQLVQYLYEFIGLLIISTYIITIMMFWHSVVPCFILKYWLSTTIRSDSTRGSIQVYLTTFKIFYSLDRNYLIFLTTIPQQYFNFNTCWKMQSSLWNFKDNK